MSKGNFLLGLVVGIAAGAAAKYLYDNKEEAYVLVTDKAKVAKEEISDFVEYASERIQNIGQEVSKKAGKYVEQAKEQFNEFKTEIKDDSKKDDDETSN